MKIILITFGIFLLSGMINAQDTSRVDTYKIAFFSKDASGGFKKMKGEVVTNGDSIPTSFDLFIETASINTGNGMQNKHAISSEWFNSEKYPHIVFKGREVVSTDRGFMVSGKLSIGGVTKAIKLPITIKTRIGYNEVEDFEFLKSFIRTTKDAGSTKFIIHARKALLKKLSPKENLNIPPLKYEFVYKLKEHFKNDEIIINGGIKSTVDIKEHLLKVDGTMIGRAVYHSPYFLAEIEKEIFNNKNVPTRTEVMENLIPYIQEQTSKGIQLNHIMRHTVGLFHGQNGSRTWKQYLSKNMCIRDADLQKVNHIMDQVKKTNPVSLER